MCVCVCACMCSRWWFYQLETTSPIRRTKWTMIVEFMVCINLFIYIASYFNRHKILLSYWWKVRNQARANYTAVCIRLLKVFIKDSICVHRLQALGYSIFFYRENWWYFIIHHPTTATHMWVLPDYLMNYHESARYHVEVKD